MREIITIASVLRRVGIIHRDVKPDNICMRDRNINISESLVLIDFGNGMFEKDMDIEGGMSPCVVAPCYRAPEV